MRENRKCIGSVMKPMVGEDLSAKTGAVGLTWLSGFCLCGYMIGSIG